MLKMLAIFNSSFNGVFSFCSFFGTRKKHICIWEDLFLRSVHSGPHKRPRSHPPPPCFSLNFFYKMPGKNKGIEKLRFTENARIRTWKEEEDTGTAMANCLGR
jgi:hypothetical protein